MDWLLVATAIRLVTAVGSVDDKKNNTLRVSVNSVHSCSGSPIGRDLCVVVLLGPGRSRLMLKPYIVTW